MLSIGLRRWYINITIKVLDIIHVSVFYLKHDVSETGFCSRLQMQPPQVGPIDRTSLGLRRQNNSFYWALLSRLYICYLEQIPQYRSGYSDQLRAGRPKGRGSSIGGAKNFRFSISFRPALGPINPPIQWVLGVRSSRVKRQEREADHTPLFSAEVKQWWSYTSTPPYVFMA
jgi:hypothetical protein